MHHLHLLVSIAVLLGAGIVGATLSRRVGLPTIVGYFVAGALVGPHGFGWVGGGSEVEFFAELGVVFLLFDIGLHFSLASLWRTRRQLFGLGPLQVALSTVLLGLAARAVGLPPEAALLVGATLALSSTAVVLRGLMASGEQATPLGRTATAVLIFQDLFAVLLLVLAQSLGGESAPLSEILWRVLWVSAAALAAVGLGGRLLRPVFAWVTRHGDDEAFTAAALLLVLTTAGAAGLAGLSMPLGAFLAGMVLSESEYCYRVKTDLKPFRGLLLGLFFLTVGMSLDLELMRSALVPILAVSVGLIGLKALAAAGAARLVGLGGGFALRLGANLAQGSEFGFVVLALAAQAGVVEPRVAAIGTAGIALSMALTAATARAGDALAERVESRRARSEADSDPVVASTRHRVLLAGIGPVAQAVARALEAMDVDYLALEWDPLRLAEGRAAGFHVVYGRADDMALVEAAGASQAQALVLGRNRPDDVRAFVSELLSRQPGLQVLLRASSEQEASELRALGALACVCAEDPDDRTLALETLRALGIDEARIARWQNAFEPDPEWEKADKAHAFSAA